MITKGKIFSCLICCLASLVVAPGLYAAMPINPRTTDSGGNVRASGTDGSSRRATAQTRTRSVIPARTVSGTARGALTNSSTRTPVSETRTRARTATSQMTTRTTHSATTNARAGRNAVLSPTNLSRSAKVRATALYNDVSKIGSGYASCRESYATCMDQICGQANDTYRRCFCSSRFEQFRNIENALDNAMIMLQQFQDNNLEAVDKTAAEVNAMYSATVGEQAIKKDTSASAKMLEEINNLLSGKTKSTTGSNSYNSIGVLDLNFSTDDLGDIWSGDADSLFGSSRTDMSTLEGAALFNEAQKQCTRVSKGVCENNAVFSMSKSSYNILISQDCNAYEKNLNKKRETVAQAVRTAEKYLREARLEEYRSHNSADVNECVAKVRATMLTDSVCGENYKRCLDPTGAYINGATGEAIYSPRLFKLEDTISLSGDVSSDVLAQNSDYDKFLENYRKYVTRDLDTCRDVADFVWTEFKRNAIIEIAQAQSNKIEEVKMSCVDTMAQCYDTQSQSLINFDQKTATAAGALGRYVARDMCREKVIACATLYSRNGEGCTFDTRGHIKDGDKCGLTSLLDFVATVDSLNVVEKCEAAIDEYVEKLCTPDNGNYEYPYNCRNMTTESLKTAISNYSDTNCKLEGSNLDDIDDRIDARIETVVVNIESDIRGMLRDICEGLDGMWYDSGKTPNNGDLIDSVAFYNQVYGRGSASEQNKQWGVCYKNSAMLQCLAYNSDDDSDAVATWDSTQEVCKFTDAWYADMCERIGGYYDKETCYIAK